MPIDHGALGATDQRTDDRVGLARIADFQALRDRHEALAEGIEDRLLDEDARIRHANLTLMEEDAERRGPHRVIDVGIGEHDQRTLAAHFQRELLQGLGRFDREMPSGLGRAGERDHAHPRIGEDGRSDFGGRSGDYAEQTLWQTGLIEHFGDLQAGHRR
jgi:hypothetical protein